MRKIITKQDEKEIIRLYFSKTDDSEEIGGESIAKIFDIHPNSVRRIIKRNGHKIRPIARKKVQIADEKKIVEMYIKNEMSAPEIAEHFNVSPSIILRYLHKNNVQMRDDEECRRKYPINKYFFDVIDTQEKAYFLGFLYADGGNLLEYNFVNIDLASKDRDILEKLASLIYMENPEIHIKDYKRCKKEREKQKIRSGCYLTINSKYVCHKLNELGCVPKKSLILTFPQWLVDPELQRHFIRGYYDGDGGIYLTDVKKRGASSKTISTLEFCNSMTEIIKVQTGIQFGNPYNDVKDKNVYSIHLGGNRNIARFLNWIYKDATIYLDRKYNLYQKLLEKNIKTDELILSKTRGYSKRYFQKEKAIIY